jgi:hypothetical protein
MLSVHSVRRRTSFSPFNDSNVLSNHKVSRSHSCRSISPPLRRARDGMMTMGRRWYERSASVLRVCCLHSHLSHSTSRTAALLAPEGNSAAGTTQGCATKWPTRRRKGHGKVDSFGGDRNNGHRVHVEAAQAVWSSRQTSAQFHWPVTRC